MPMAILRQVNPFRLLRLCTRERKNDDHSHATMHATIAFHVNPVFAVQSVDATL